jgi:hypothetical protein
MPGIGIGIGTWASGGASFTPRRLTGLILWLDASFGITEAGLGVDTWLDRSDEGNDATQTTDADRPAYTASNANLNSRPSVDFVAASTEFMSLTGMTDASNDYTMFAVVDQTTITGTQALLGSSSTTRALGHESSSVSANDSTAWRAGMAGKTGGQILCQRFDATGTTIEHYRDGALLGSTTYDATWAWAVPMLGNRNGGAEWLDADVAEVIVYNRLLSDAELAQVHAYLIAKYQQPFDYDSVADLAVAYKSDENTTGDPVSAWASALGTGDDMTQGTADRRPTLGTIGGREAPLYDGSDDRLAYSGAAGDWNDLHDGTGGTLLVVFENDFSTTGALFATHNNAATQYGVEVLSFTSGVMRLRVGNGSGTWLVDDTTAAVVSADTPTVVAVRLLTGASDEFDFRIDGTQRGNGAFVGAASATDATGAATCGTRPAGTQPFTGLVGDIVRYSRYLSDLEAAAIEELATERFPS